MTYGRQTQHFSFYCATPDFISGLSSYTDSFISTYADCYPQHQIVLHTNVGLDVLQGCKSKPNIQFQVMDAPKSLPFKLGVLWAQTRLAFRLRGNKRPLVSTTPIASVVPFCPLIITMHDLYDVDFRYRRWHNVVYFRLLYIWLGLITTQVLAVSKTTADLSKPYFGPIGRKVFVAKEASKFEVCHEDDIALNRPRGTVLYVANVNNTKNFECLVKTLKLAEKDDTIALKVKWVGHDKRGFASHALASHGGCNALEALGSISDEELIDLYKTCDALIVTSWTEGFCLPVLEAQSFGCPVIVSDIPIMHEVAGEDSFFFSPSAPHEALARIKEFISADTNEVEARRDALANARKFSWEQSVRLLEERVA